MIIFAKPNIKNKEIDDWIKEIMAVANHQNVYCKVSGMVTEADWKHWRQDDFKPYPHVVFEAFGAGSIMPASD